jgi:uncharacterized membrane protein YgcG
MSSIYEFLVSRLPTVGIREYTADLSAFAGSFWAIDLCAGLGKLGAALNLLRNNQMMHRCCWAAILTMSTCCLLLANSPSAVAPEVRDDGKLFSAATLKKANETIADIYRKYDRDVLVETFTSVPAADVEKVQSMDKDKRTAYFLQWAKDRTKERVVNGVYVIICKEPRHLQVGVVEKEPHKFPPGTRDAIDNVLLKEFREGRFDEGLEQTLVLIQEKLAKK